MKRIYVSACLVIVNLRLLSIHFNCICLCKCCSMCPITSVCIKMRVKNSGYLDVLH